MSLDSTANLKQQLITILGPKAPIYFESLQNFVSGKISRAEFEDTVKQVLNTPTLLQIHNALIISLFDATATYKRNALNAAANVNHANTPPPPALAPKPPPRKRRRTLLPYQGPGVPEDARTLRNMRFKRWILAMGRRERERIQGLQNAGLNGGALPPPTALPVPAPVEGQRQSSQPPPLAPPVPQPQQQQPSAIARPRPDMDEIACERGVTLLSERGGPPGGRPPVQLHSTTHAPTLQHIADRINLVCTQHNLGPPPRAVPLLMSLACEAHLKQLITHAITLTLSSQAISSVSLSTASSSNPFSSSSEAGQSSATLVSSSSHHHLPQKAPVLTASAFQTLFSLYPSSLPNRSAAAMKLATIPSPMDDDSDDVPVLKDREVRDQRWQIMALLAERSTVRDSLKAVR